MNISYIEIFPKIDFVNIPSLKTYLFHKNIDIAVKFIQSIENTEINNPNVRNFDIKFRKKGRMNQTRCIKKLNLFRPFKGHNMITESIITISYIRIFLPSCYLSNELLTVSLA